MADQNSNLGRDQNPRQGTSGWSSGNGGSSTDYSEQGSGLSTRPSGRWSSTPARRPGAGSAYASPFTLMRRMVEDMDRIFDDFGMGTHHYAVHPGSNSLVLQDPWRSGASLNPSTWVPEVEVFRKGDKVIVRADLPGLKKDEVKVEVENDVLTISGQRSEEKEEDRTDLYRSERMYGSFFRSIPLPDGTDAEKCEATFKDGVLEVQLKAPPAPETTRKSIPVK